MAKFGSKHRFDHTSELIFDLISDLEAHPDLIPLCKRVKVLGLDETDDQVDKAIVRYVLAYQRYSFRKTLELAVETDFDNRTMTMVGNNKESRSVNFTVRVTPASDGGSEVRIEGHYKLSDLTMAVADKSGMLNSAFEKIMTALDHKARQVRST